MKHIAIIVALGIAGQGWSQAMVAATPASSTTAAESPNQKMGLKDALAYAREHNASYLNAQKDVFISQETVKQTVALGKPQLSASAGFQQFLTVPGSWIKNFVQQPGSPEYIFLKFQQEFTSNASLAVNQLLWDGSYMVGLQATQQFMQMSRLAETKTLRDLENTVTKSYIVAVSTQKNLALIDANLALLERSLFEVRELNKEGFAEQLDVERLELNVSNLKLQKEKLANAVVLTKNILKMQMGMPIDSDLELSDDLEALETAITISDVDVATFSVNNRIENRILEQAITLGKLDQKRYKFSSFPSLVAFYQHQENTQRPEFNFFKSNLSQNNAWVPSDVWGLSMRVPIYGGGSVKSKIRETELKIAKAQNDLNNFQRYATMEYENSKNSYMQNLEAVMVQKKNIQLADKIYNKSMTKFREGVGSTLEITQAETELRTANNAYLNALYDLVNSKIDLKNAIGQSIQP